MELTKLQRNQIFAVIVAMGLDPADSYLEARNAWDRLDEETRQVVYLRHEPSKSWVMIEQGAQGGTYGTAARVPGGSWWRNEQLAWDQILAFLRDWADEINHATRTPEFWDELKEAQAAIATVDASDADNTPFSEAEQEQIRAAFTASIEAARQHHALPEEHVAAIAEGVRELVEASRTLGRKDWLAMVGSAGFGWIASNLVPGNVAVHIVGLALREVAHMFGVDLPPLELG